MLRKVFGARELREGAVRPRWYGLAWRDFYSGTTVWYPIGVHLIAGLLHQLCGWKITKVFIPNWYPSLLDQHIIRKVIEERSKKVEYS